MVVGEKIDGRKNNNNKFLCRFRTTFLERNIVPGSIKYVDLETYLTKSRANSKKRA